MTHRELARIEIVEDRTEGSRCDEGFLRLRRLRLENHYTDGTHSASYACDIVSSRFVDAVAVVVHGPRGDEGVQVALRTNARPPIVLRQERCLAHDDPTPLLLPEIIAGVLEDEDAGAGGIEARAAAEGREEGGYALDAPDIKPLGASVFPSPGITDERVHLRRVEVADLEDRSPPPGDGSVMEEAGGVILLPLREAIRRCRTGEIPDMKTEIGLLRLADAIGYVPHLDLFVSDLPEALAHRARSLPPLLAPEA